MITNAGDFPTGATVYIPFNTFDSNDPSASVTITNLANTDVHIHKDGGTTQRSSANGITVSTDFDTITGNHLVSIDLSDNTDAGFYAAGSEYQVRIEGTTVDAATINAWIGMFSIERSGGVATILTDTEAVLTDSEAILTDTEAVLADTEAAVPVLTDTEAILADSEAIRTDTETTLLTDTEAILADTEAATTTAIADAVWDEAQAAHVAAGSFGVIATEIADTLTDTEAILTDSEAILADTEAAVPVLTDTEAILADSEAIRTDTETTLLTDTEAILADTEATVADTNELQGDWTDGGRLDLLLDAALADTEAILTDSEAILADTAEIGAAGAGLTEAGGTGDHLTAVPWNASWDAEVQSEVEDALTAARSEPTGVPAANESLVDKVNYLFMALRNKLDITASKKQFYDDGGAVEWEKDLSDDGTTYSESEGNAP